MADSTAKHGAPFLAFLALAALLLSSVACQTAAAFALPTLTPTATESAPATSPSPTPVVPTVAMDQTAADPTSSASTPTPTPETVSPSPALTRAPSPAPTSTPVPSPTLFPTETPTPEPTVPTFSFEDPVLTPVPRPGSDTTRVPTPVPVPEMAPGIINIVVLGSDRRPSWDDWHTDVVQVVSIQPSVPAVTVLSIPRDLYLYIPGFWMSRINFADMYGEIHDYPGGGPALVRQTLLYNLGIPVHLYVRTDFDGFIGIVNALGGVDIPVHCRLEDYWPEKDDSGWYPIKVLEPGYHHMDGDTALWYARSRKTTSVFNREERQQQVLYAIWGKARSLELLPQVPALWQQLNEMVVTDVQLTDVIKLADVAFRLDESSVRFRNIGAEHVIPWRTPYGGAVFLPNWEKVGPVVADVLAPISEGRLQRAQQSVEVWNGTPGADWDYLAADRLLRQGYVAVIGEPDHRDHGYTQLIDFTSTSKGSAIPYLQEMFQVADANVISAPDPESPVQYRLIIGSDYQTCRSP